MLHIPCLKFLFKLANKCVRLYIAEFFSGRNKRVFASSAYFKNIQLVFITINMDLIRFAMLMVGLIALFPAKSVALFEYCENNNCTETGTICQTGSNQCVCNGATHYQTASNTCDANRNVKPTLECPSYVTVAIMSQNDGQQQVIDFLISYDSGNTLSINPTTIQRTLGNIGTAQIAVVSLTDDFGRSSECTFMIHFTAGVCFQETLYPDSYAVRSCVGTANGLSCNSTCNNGYIFNDDLMMKTFECAGASWTFPSDLDIFCLPIENPAFLADVSLKYENSFVATECLEDFKTDLDDTLPIFENNIFAACGLQWDVTVKTEPVRSQVFQFETTLQLNLITLSSTSAERQACIYMASNVTKGIFAFPDQYVCGFNGLHSATVEELSISAPVEICITSTYNIRDIPNSGKLCLPCGPGFFYDSQTSDCQQCSSTQYQDLINQVECKNCPSATAPGPHKIDCVRTCPEGFSSASGYYPCEPCPVDSYWVDSKNCIQCPGNKTTDGKKGSVNVEQCKGCPPLQDGVTFTVSITSTTEGGVATYTCNTGYAIGDTTDTTSQRTCTSGSWTGTEPNCTPVDCGNLGNLNNGVIMYNPDTKYQATATYACNNGYVITGSTATTHTRQCTTSGTWDGAVQTCTKRDCGGLSDPTDGQVSVYDTTYGSQATYTCNTGYDVTGTSSNTLTVTCTASGTWSQTTVSCTIKNCGTPSDPQNGQVNIPGGTTYGSTATYICNTGYIISGTVSDTTRQVTCLSTGFWSQTVTCVIEADPLGATCTNPVTTGLTQGQSCTGDNAFCLQRSSNSQEYTCQCSAAFYDDNGNDPAGQCKSVSELAVQDITLHSVTTTSMRVTWNPPTNKATFISGYTVEWRPKGSNVLGSTSGVLTNTFFDITSDVESGRVYSVTVTSRNQIHYSDAIKTTSNQKEQALKPATPGPINTASSNFDAENDNTIDLVWTPSTGTVYRYDVRLREGDNGLTGIAPSNPSGSLTYRNIKNGHRYDITIVAESQQFNGINYVRSETHREQIKTVVKVPSAPRSVECLRTTDTSVTISWQAPSTPNGDLVQYKVDTYQFGNPTRLKSEDTGDLDLDFEVTGLDPGSFYYFIVFTINEQYTSDGIRLTQSFCQIKATMADAPNNLQVTNIESRNATISWTRPANTYGEHLGYIVQIRMLDETCVKQLVISCTGCINNLNVNSLENMCDQSFSMTEQLSTQEITSDTLLSRTFTGLDPDVLYNVIVTAVNTEGRGRIANQTLQTEEEVPQKPKSVTITDLTATSCTVTWDIDGPRPGDTTYTVTVNPVTPATYADATVRGFSNRTHVLSGLQEYWYYTITIRATTSEGSMDSDSITFQTLPAAPGLVNGFSIIPNPNDDYRKMEVRWQLPVLLERNGVIDRFVLRHNTSQDMNNQMMTFNKNADDSFAYVQVFNVIPEVYYNFKVFAVNTESENGAEKEVTIMAPAGVPRNDFEETNQRSVINESLATSNLTTLRLTYDTEFFSQNTNGDIVLSGVIICAESKCSNNEVGSSLTKAQFETYPNWHDAQPDGFSKYRCTRPEWRQQASIDRKRRQVQTTEEFTIGTESCNKTTQNEFCNGPLSPGTSYVVHVVICTNGGCLISNEYGPFATQQVSVVEDDSSADVVVVAVVVPVVLIVAVVIIAFTIYRRKFGTNIRRNVGTRTRSEENTKKQIKIKNTAITQSHELTQDMTDKEVIEWLKVNGLEKCKARLKGYKGKDMFNLTKEDLTLLCGLTDGIRIYNMLKESTSKRDITERTREQALYMELDDTKRDGVPYENIEMDRSHLYSALQHV